MAIATKWRRNIAENFDRLSMVHERYRRTDYDRRNCDGIYPNVTQSRPGKKRKTELSKYEHDNVIYDNIVKTCQ